MTKIKEIVMTKIIQIVMNKILDIFMTKIIEIVKLNKHKLNHKKLKNSLINKKQWFHNKLIINKFHIPLLTKIALIIKIIKMINLIVNKNKSTLIQVIFI